jgi:hypothetical protein
MAVHDLFWCGSDKCLHYEEYTYIHIYIHTYIHTKNRSTQTLPSHAIRKLKTLKDAGIRLRLPTDMVEMKTRWKTHDVHIYIYIYIYTYIYIHAYIQTYTHTDVLMDKLSHTQNHTHVSMFFKMCQNRSYCAYIYTHTHIYMHTYIHVSMICKMLCQNCSYCAYIYIYIHIYVYIYSFD